MIDIRKDVLVRLDYILTKFDITGYRFDKLIEAKIDRPFPSPLLIAPVRKSRGRQIFQYYVKAEVDKWIKDNLILDGSRELAIHPTTYKEQYEVVKRIQTHSPDRVWLPVVDVLTLLQLTEPTLARYADEEYTKEKGLKPFPKHVKRKFNAIAINHWLNDPYLPQE